MPVTIQPYTEEWVPAVKAFNTRLAAGGVSPDFRFPESPRPHWLPRLSGRRIYQEYYLAPENGDVRGGFILKYQPFWLGGEIRPVAYYHLPLSEGIVNRSYAGVGLQMLRSALKCHPLLFALGMGGYDKPLPQMLRAMGWPMWTVPFYFKVLRPWRFLRKMRALRENRARALAAEAAAWTGLGWLGIHALQAAGSIRAGGKLGRGAARHSAIAEFGPWADEIWERGRSECAMVAERGSETLNVLYAGERFIRLQTGGKTPTGWAVVMDTAMRDDKYFGDLRVGTIADCFAAPGCAGEVVAAAVQVLAERGVDLIVSNQGHGAWCLALRASGFLQGPSNFIFAASPALGSLIGPTERSQQLVHMTRGDGDGPIHL